MLPYYCLKTVKKLPTSVYPSFKVCIIIYELMNITALKTFQLRRNHSSKCFSPLFNGVGKHHPGSFPQIVLDSGVIITIDREIQLIAIANSEPILLAFCKKAEHKQNSLTYYIP